MDRYRDEDYIKIIPTAYLTAYPRTFTDIPYSQEIFALLERKLQNDTGYRVDEELKIQKLAPELEARFKLINILMQRTGIVQILELASGLSTRGLDTVKDPKFKYVELDLRQMANTKIQLIEELAGSPPNLHIVGGNALKASVLMRATDGFDHKKRLCVLNEGLLRYLNFTEKTRVARNIHRLLELFGGVWITSDITLQKLLTTQDSITMPGKNAMISTSTEKDFIENSFANEKQAVTFFEDLGFIVENHQFSEVFDLLVSPQRLSIAESEAREIIQAGRVFVMRINAS